MVVAFPRGQLSAKDKERLTKHGIIAVEADDPGAVRVLEMPISQPHPVQYDDMLMAALHALNGCGTESRDFVTELRRRLLLREQTRSGEGGG